MKSQANALGVDLFCCIEEAKDLEQLLLVIYLYSHSIITNLHFEEVLVVLS